MLAIDMSAGDGAAAKTSGAITFPGAKLLAVWLHVTAGATLSLVTTLNLTLGDVLSQSFVVATDPTPRTGIGEYLLLFGPMGTAFTVAGGISAAIHCPLGPLMTLTVTPNATPSHYQVYVEPLLYDRWDL